MNVAVLLPCYNEAVAIAKVVADFRNALPQATVYVYDNASTDGTSDVARKAGAVVRRVGAKGKGNVIRQMFADIEADIYVMADGDDTYDATVAPGMIETLQTEDLDMVVGIRVSEATDMAAYRTGHRLGNQLFTALVGSLFGRSFTDIFSGYRIMTRRFVKSFPVTSRGFEIETELTIHALDLGLPVGERPVSYRSRPEDSVSKLRTYRDGARILLAILLFMKEVHPLRVFTLVAVLCTLAAWVIAWPVIAEFMHTGLVPRLPTAVLATGLQVSGLLALACGLILDSVARGRKELKRLFYVLHRSKNTD
ncbi:MAG: glycosyltransferase [Alphaproteobacteria bacterium]|nr:glycosyltransferase [Alphaproteobacteria bacterium]